MLSSSYITFSFKSATNRSTLLDLSLIIDLGYVQMLIFFTFITSLVSFFVTFIACLAISSPKQSSHFVWTYFLKNETGWPDGVVFLTGLINPNYMFSGIDGAIHLAEDCINASIAVPRALLATLVIGFTTAFIFAISMLYYISDLNNVVSTLTQVPIFETWRQATRSAGAVCVFTILLIAIALFSLNGCMKSSSRLTWSFARDDALFASKYFGRIHPKFRVPVWGAVFNSVVIFIIGCVYLGSATAFGALIGVGLVLQQLCFAVPIVLLMMQGRPAEHRRTSVRGKTGYFATFDMGVFGWLINGLTVAWSIVSLIFYDFPDARPPTGLSMNYTCAVLGGIAIFSAINWFAYARKRYQGPTIDVSRFAEKEEGL
jgi:choline transport protein